MTRLSKGISVMSPSAALGWMRSHKRGT
jgi:hypothetical protein